MELVEFEEVLSHLIENMTIEEHLINLGHIARFDKGAAYLFDFETIQDLNFFKSQDQTSQNVVLMKFKQKEQLMNYIEEILPLS